jgi:hypothetical protein
VIAIYWKARQRLGRTWRRLTDERGKCRTLVAVAVAPAVTGFVCRSPAPERAHGTWSGGDGEPAFA